MERATTCRCGLAAHLAARPRFPVIFDEQTGEYQIKAGRHRITMWFCPSCGGSLPSKRDSLFTTPSEDEVREIRQLLAGARSAFDVIAVLGPPDETVHWTDPSPDEWIQDGERWERTLQYGRRWSTLHLLVFEHPGGSISYGITGKLKPGGT